MRRSDKLLSPKHGKANHPVRGNQRGLPILALCLALAGCGKDSGLQTFGFSSHSNFAGMVASDEPNATLVGRDVLAAGGSPADAIVAMSFALAVTLPTQVSLGSSGICMVYDHGASKAETLDFLVPPAASGGASLVPALPRAMFALHAKYGARRWDQLLGPAEGLARVGVPASRSFVRQYAPVAPALLADPLAQRNFARADGAPLGEGDLLAQPELAGIIARMGSRGVGEFYQGDWAREFVAAAARIGATIGEQELRAYVPAWSNPAAVKFGNDTAFFAATPAGQAEQAAWTRLARDGAWAEASAQSRAGLVAAALPAAANQSGAAAETGTGLVAVGNDGSAATCLLTLNRPFGTGRVVPGFGMFLAAPASAPGPAPMLVLNLNSNNFHFAAAAGGAAGSAATVEVGLRAQLDGTPLRDAIADMHRGAGREASSVNAAHCASPGGNFESGLCSVATDPKGAGLALATDLVK